MKTPLSSNRKSLLKDGIYIFVPSNDTHVKLFLPITAKMKNAKFFVLDGKDEGAEKLLGKYKVNFDVWNTNNIKKEKVNVVILGNDWGDCEMNVIKDCRKMKIPTVCMQEGCLDFSKTDGVERMRYCDIPFVQGPETMKYLNRKNYFIVGNPRFENEHTLVKNNKNLVMINLNFTYGIHEDIRDAWLSDVINACKRNNLKYFISKHPRDKSNYPGLPVIESSADNVYKQIKRSTILVSRFSTLIYEAALLGKGVIYYNPHKEKMSLFNNDKSGGIEKVYTRNDLVKTLNYLAINGPDYKKREVFIKRHCPLVGDDSVAATIHALKQIPSKYEALVQQKYNDSLAPVVFDSLQVKVKTLIKTILKLNG